MLKELRALYGLKYNPFGEDVPIEALRVTPRVDDFGWRIEHGLAHEGGFAMITGDVGRGKSGALRLIADRLDRMREVTVGCIEHPQSSLADFYREMGDCFGVSLRPHNRWAGFRSLRQKWVGHIESTLMRPLLLIDEAQEMTPSVLNELRILSSTRFDSRSILSVVIAGDDRLPDKLRNPALLPLGSRIRTRLLLEAATVDELRECLTHRMKAAGNAKLMSKELGDTLCEHSLGSYRVLLGMAAELLAVAVRRQLDSLDEKLYLDVFTDQAPPPQKPSRPSRSRRR
ncbi:MAG: ExeA family protein [Planctomycetota bacterium]|jgi:type II secretory pathway predicted ATPase ExeA